MLIPHLALVLSVILSIPSKAETRPRCGGTLTDRRGILQSPNFPHKFAVPIHCEWIIDASHFSTGGGTSAIYIYLTQLYVFEGLSFKEYQIYDQSYQLNGRDVHAVTESNVTKLSYLQSTQDYLVVTLKLDSIESTHLRVLDHLLDVYGFNITYEISEGSPRSDRCTMMDCGFTGICRDYFTHFECDCFTGFQGKTCSEGPNSLCNAKTCQNGGICMHVGDSSVRCECQEGYQGERCEKSMEQSTQDQGCERCFVTCPFDGRMENACKCPEGRNSTLGGGSGSGSNDGIIVGYAIKMKLLPLGGKGTHLRTYLENYLSKILKDTAGIDSGHIIDFQSLQTHVKLTIQLSAGKKDERRLKSITSKWTERGHVGNLTLASAQPAISLTPLTTLTLQGISVYPTSQIHASEDFALSCVASFAHNGGDAVTASSFRWFKDDLFINVTTPTSGKSSRLIEDGASFTRDQYVSELSIKNASPIDQGTFSCQVVESGVQRCYTKRIEIRAPPRVWIEPMSLTVRKGENFTIKCFSASTNYLGAKYTYSWTKNKELLPIKTETEHYEVLFPMGSILQVSTISKSTVFSCLVQDSAVWAEQSILVNVIDSELIKTCPGERHMKLLWPETAPGTESLQECPEGYMGMARRACTLREAGRPIWYLPDFAGCVSDQLETLNAQFQKVRLGYEATKPLNVLFGYKRYLNGNRSLLPGEGFTVLQLVDQTIDYMNNSISSDVYDTVFDLVDSILQRKLSLINETQVILLQEVVKRQSLVFQSTFHRTLATIDVTLTKPDKTGFHVPQSGQRYPGWFSYKLHLALPRHYFASSSSPASATTPNKSATLAAVVYRNLSAFLPLRSAIRLKDGIEMDYEVISNVVGCWLTYNGSELKANLTDILYTMEFQHPAKNASQDAWNVQCGVADYASYGYAWDTQSCITRLLASTRTRCICPRSGTYAILLTMKPSFADEEEVPSRQLVILAGCSICTLLITLAALILAVYWFYRRSCLVFLKVQCCLSMLGSMLVFIYALWDEVPAEFFLTVMSILESFLLTGLSSQLSNLLIIYSELVQLPRMKSIKQTVVLIITGAPMIAVFGNHMTHLTMNTRIGSWWLLRGSLSFNIFVTCCTIIVLLYFMLLYIVLRKLARVNIKYEKRSEAIQYRLKLLKRSVFVFCAITATVSSSILYINSMDNELCHYAFSGLAVLMGAVIFFCYVLYSETPFKQLLITRLKDGHTEKQSPDTSKHLKFFTKEKPEVENDAMPYFCTTVETRFVNEVICKQKYAEIGPTSFKTAASGNFNGGDTDATGSHSTNAYRHHPQMECLNSPDLLGTKKFVELDLVASASASIPGAAVQQTETCFYSKKAPCITITQPPDEQRLRPEGEEMILTGEVIPIISVKETPNDAIVADNLDAVMDSITHDLDYLLNDNEFEAEANASPATQTAANSGSLRRISKPPSLAVFEQIDEEPEEEIKVPEAITNVSRTSC